MKSDKIDKKLISVVVPVDLYHKIQLLANKNCRSISNYIVTILKDICDYDVEQRDID